MDITHTGLSYICDYLLSWFLEIYESGEHEMSAEVYDRAIFIVGVGVPMLTFIAVLVALVAMYAAVFKMLKTRG